MELRDDLQKKVDEVESKFDVKFEMVPVSSDGITVNYAVMITDNSEVLETKEIINFVDDADGFERIFEGVTIDWEL